MPKIYFIITPVFFVAEPDESTSIISIANKGAVDLNPGNLTKNMPCLN